MPPAPADQENIATVFLLANATWNDFGFYTSFILHTYVTDRWQRAGWVSIGYRGQGIGVHTFSHLGEPDALSALPSDCFSLGEGLGYYSAVRDTFGEAQALEVLAALRDSAVSMEPHERGLVESEHVFQVSLLRSNGALEAREQAAAVFGRAALDYTNSFTARIWMKGASDAHVFGFDFSPKAVPSRINVLVGLNGTGKTQSMATLARLLSRVHSPRAETDPDTRLDERSSIQPRPSVYGVVAISFSAFDDFIIPDSVVSDRFKYVYCGLKSLTGSVTSRAEIVDSEVASRFLPLDVEARRLALESLRPTLDPEYDWDGACESGAVPFTDLSAGQRIVLSIASELLQSLSNRVLVLMDEPEIHLHPQLLSGLLAWTDELLKERDSFAIVATHSPIVVQQALASSVFILRRTGTYPSVGRPTIETFGANLTEIVREVFEDRAGDRSYETVLDRLWEEHGSVEAVSDLFDGRLGLNAEIYLRSLQR